MTDVGQIVTYPLAGYRAVQTGMHNNPMYGVI